MSDKTLYDNLGLGSDAAPECVRAAYLEMSARLDAASAIDPADPQLPVRRLAVKEAYAILSNAARRRAYDESLRMRRLQNAAQSAAVQNPSSRTVFLAILVLSGAAYYGLEALRAASETERTAAARIGRQRPEHKPAPGAAQRAGPDKDRQAPAPGGTGPQVSVPDR